MEDPRPVGSGVRPFPGEPVIGRWRWRTWADIARELVVDSVGTQARPMIVAIDGRSGSGKSTAAARLAEEVSGAVIVHTDDVAWWESFFDWDHLLAAGVLVPLRRGGGVSYRPPAWDVRSREGAIEVPAGTPLVIVEGVGASRRSLATLVDATVWVQSDRIEARRRGIGRDGGDPAAVAFWEEWESAEVPFLAGDRPWERATLTICGTPDLVPADQVPVDRQAALQRLLGGPERAEAATTGVLVALAGFEPPEPSCRC